ncbi:HxlR family transcriptional regulator [Nanohaloarchaea archaeon SG9]|nr:HxlR family transcriptional regulator [Nanohaloarchaea archaeon SG9]
MTEKLGVWCAGEDWCPVSATASIIAKKWHPVIIHRLLEIEEMGFNDLKKEVDGVSSKVLSESLDDLEEKGLIEREVISEKPVRVKYRLTEKGKALESVISEMAEWGRKNLQAVEKEQSVA